MLKIVREIVLNANIPTLDVGVYKPDSSEGKATIAAAERLTAERKELLARSVLTDGPLNVLCFDSATAEVSDPL